MKFQVNTVLLEEMEREKGSLFSQIRTMESSASSARHQFTEYQKQLQKLE